MCCLFINAFIWVTHGTSALVCPLILVWCVFLELTKGDEGLVDGTRSEGERLFGGDRCSGCSCSSGSGRIRSSGCRSRGRGRINSRSNYSSFSGCVKVVIVVVIFVVVFMIIVIVVFVVLLIVVIVVVVVVIMLRVVIVTV